LDGRGDQACGRRRPLYPAGTSTAVILIILAGVKPIEAAYRVRNQSCHLVVEAHEARWQKIYRCPKQPMSRRMGAVIEALPHVHPRLGPVAIHRMHDNDFAAMLDQAIERSGRHASNQIEIAPTLQILENGENQDDDRDKGGGALGWQRYCEPELCFPVALSRQVIRLSTLNGLVRKPSAPAPSARSRVLSSGLAVTKIIGVRLPFAISRLCRSTPLMPGIRTSVTRHSVSDKQPDSRNSSPDAKIAVA
jgi:hypothetical protein